MVPIIVDTSRFKGVVTCDCIVNLVLDRLS